jgi:hypothetical protein
MFMACSGPTPTFVMPGLVPGIHVLCSQSKKQGVDGRDKPGHDGGPHYQEALPQEATPDQAGTASPVG